MRSAGTVLSLLYRRISSIQLGTILATVMSELAMDWMAITSTPKGYLLPACADALLASASAWTFYFRGTLTREKH
ncbi:hypothetical protein B296_00025929 [Ensete ventricosum]|uniref:Uncharacterized protein n=1 Tax=Ensete ventricosum TaxID=4639 RepID=A0A426ZVH5_ENSVE|nr:hypothetical protein B296_00025929 [Ensete ventricosum]